MSIWVLMVFVMKPFASRIFKVSLPILLATTLKQLTVSEKEIWKSFICMAEGFITQNEDKKYAALYWDYRCNYTPGEN